MKTKKDFIELGEWQLNAFKQRDKYKQALEKIREIAKCRIENLVILEQCNEVLEDSEDDTTDY